MKDTVKSRVEKVLEEAIKEHKRLHKLCEEATDINEYHKYETWECRTLTTILLLNDILNTDDKDYIYSAKTHIR